MLRYAFGSAVAAVALAFAPAANATDFHVGDPNFQITSGDPFSPSITAVFFNGFDTSLDFDDSFLFTIPQDGVGSGSISTSFSSNNLNMLVIDELYINNVLYDVPSNGSGQSISVGGIPIVNGVLNTIRVVGHTVGSGTYSGTATFSAVAVPEPAVWGLMIAGFAVMGAAFRRRPMRVSFS